MVDVAQSMASNYLASVLGPAAAFERDSERSTLHDDVIPDQLQNMNREKDGAEEAPCPIDRAGSHPFVEGDLRDGK